MEPDRGGGVRPDKQMLPLKNKLYMSLRTIKGHIQNIKTKTGSPNKTGLAVRAEERSIAINYPSVEIQ